MIFKMSLHGKAPFLITMFLLANGCSSVPIDRIRPHPAPVVYAQPNHYQVAPRSSWRPVAPVMASIQIGSPDVVPLPRSEPVAEAVKPEVVLPPPPEAKPPQVKKQESKVEIVKKEERRKSEKHSNKKNPPVNFLSRFDGINWGDAPKPNMKMIGDENETKEPSVSAYTIDYDDAPAFGLKPGMIIYYFKLNRFHKVEIIWEPEEAEHELLEKNVLGFFGEPAEAPVLGSYHWISSQPKMIVRFSDVNAIEAFNPGHLMSLMVERLE